MVWSSPLQIALSVYWLHKQLGNAIFAGLAVIILAIPLNFIITMKKLEESSSTSESPHDPQF